MPLSGPKSLKSPACGSRPVICPYKLTSSSLYLSNLATRQHSFHKLEASDSLARIAIPAKLGNVRRLHFLVRQPLPRNLGKPPMIKHIRTPPAHIPQTQTQIRDQQPAHQVHRQRLKIPRILDSARPDTLIEPHRVRFFGEKGGCAGEHFVQEDADGVPVDRLVVRFLVDDLGCEVVGCAAQGPCDVWDVFGEPKVGKLDVSVCAEELPQGVSWDKGERGGCLRCFRV
jgi:hypothetical protein